MKTFTPKESDIIRAWHVIDAEDAVLGRLATEVANLLRGKHKVIWVPHQDTVDHVIVINAARLDISARKAVEKQYYRHSGYPGGLKQASLQRMLERHPDRIIKLAVRGMLPKGPLGRSMLRKLRVYAGPTHPHVAQNPVERVLPARSRKTSKAAS